MGILLFILIWWLIGFSNYVYDLSEKRNVIIQDIGGLGFLIGLLGPIAWLIWLAHISKYKDNVIFKKRNKDEE